MTTRPFHQPTGLTARIVGFKVFYLNLKHIVSAIFERYEVNIGSEAKKWQIFPYRQYQDERYTGRLVFGGHVVRLKHAESGGFINIDDEGRLATGDMQGYLRIYTGP